MKSVLNSLFFVLIMISLLSCGEDEGGDVQIDDFDRSTMLTNWADNIIIPSYEHYAAKLEAVSQAVTGFESDPGTTSLENLRAAVLEAYTAWQEVSMFEIGKAEALSLRNYTNIYPADTSKIHLNILGGAYNLELPSNYAAQGFPALDYLLFGLSEDAAETAALLSNSPRLIYVKDIVDRLNALTTEVLNDWKNTYRDGFIANDGSSATSSVDKMVNDFIFYYERFLRAGKIGIPAGVFSGTPISTSVEAPYHGLSSKAYFTKALNTFIDVFNGKHYDSSATGQSLRSYLDHLNTEKNGESLMDLINNQLTTALAASDDLNANFKVQVETDNTQMLEVYDELQKVVVLLKVDMMQALNIKVDFVDADGD